MYLILDLLVSIALTIGAYWGIPIIILAVGKPLKQQKIKLISILNAAFIYIMFSIVNFHLDNGPANFGACLLWGVLTYRLMRKYCSESSVVQSTQSNIQSAEASWSINYSPEGPRQGTSKIAIMVIVILIVALISTAFLSYKEIKKSESENYVLGYDEGYKIGSEEGYASGYDSGYEVGHKDGHKEGREYGYEFGYRDGYDDGLNYGKPQVGDFFKKYGNRSYFP